MYAIKEGLKRINGETVETFGREVVETNTELIVEAGTTGYTGGVCRDAGGRTYLSAICECGDFHFRSIENDKGQMVGVEIACCGDAGLDAVVKALEFAQTVIDDQRRDVDN